MSKLLDLLRGILRSRPKSASQQRMRTSAKARTLNKLRYGPRKPPKCTALNSNGKPCKLPQTIGSRGHYVPACFLPDHRYQVARRRDPA